jgi:pimeloyl-ACP methyl ester carboxylesterase
MPTHLIRPYRPALAYDLQPGTGPTIVFLPGYMSDMEGSKALALADWAAREDRAMLRLDYSGCGASEGVFADGTLAVWRDDVLDLIDGLTQGPVLLVGSSMGGWLMLLVALARPDRVAGLVGIAAAPDFTEWGFSTEDKQRLIREGRIEEPSAYSDQPYLTTRAFWESGQANLLLDSPIAITAPVHLLQGQQDPDVPWQTALRFAEAIDSADVQLTLIKDGDHRLSRPGDIALLIAIVAGMIARFSADAA